MPAAAGQLRDGCCRLVCGLGLLFAARGSSLAALGRKRKKEQRLSRKDGTVLVKHLVHRKRLAGHLDKLHVGAAALLEAKVDDGVWVEREQVSERLHEQGKGRLKVHAFAGENHVGLVVDNLLRQRFSPKQQKTDLMLVAIRPTHFWCALLQQGPNSGKKQRTSSVSMR